eukprot:comp7337_c0_seq1/m.3037 comp7337_c0_seq1/g.3037  ORF comp7337_c0_seq1/g.3037 comp7337_c0_seq1/m.3037 type:complete len:187 (-) comp7337_c0_seq1:336-896(-)
MGGIFTKLFQRLLGKEPARILMLGLDNAGKTTILYRLQGELVNTVPTVGFNVESLKFSNVALNVWDIGGQDKVRPLWRHYFEGTRGLVFVVDSSDSRRVPEAADELVMLLGEPEMATVPVLVLANKQDMPSALKPEQLGVLLKLPADRVWNIQPTCATSGDGLYDAMEWLVDRVAPHRKKKKYTAE